MGYKLALPPKRPDSIEYRRNKWANMTKNKTNADIAH